MKQLKSEHRLALTGTPLENRLLDLWSIVDFIQPGYLGNQDHFTETYEPRGEDAESAQRIARRRLSAKLRPLLLRRLKKHVAKDLPDRIEQRRDCQLGDEQRKLYLAELRRSREQVMKTVAEKGLNKSKMHVLAALTRLRQICCHPEARRQRHRLRQDRDPVRAARLADGRGPEGAGLQPVRADAAIARRGMPPAPDPHPHPHRPDQGPAGGRQRLPERPERRRCSC